MLTFPSLCPSDLQKDWREHTRGVYCQSLYQGTNRKLFPVVQYGEATPAFPLELSEHEREVGQRAPSSEALLGIAQLEELDLGGFKSWVPVEPDAASVGLFIHSSGIYHHLEDCKEITSNDNISSVAQPAELANWQPVMLDWLKTRMKRIYTKNTIQLRRLVLSNSV